jgi:hypothetical protein
MTSPVLTPISDPAATVLLCDACGHPLGGHDATAARYCKATVANALSRGCVCSQRF